MNRKLPLLLFALILIFSCRPDEEDSFNEIVKFQIEARKNAHVLKKTIDFQINGNLIEAEVPAGTDLTDLIATFSSSGKFVRIKDVLQESGVTINDFSQPLTYIVEAEDGSIRNYQVVIKPSAETAKLITSFKFEVKNNAAQLLAEVVCEITENSIIGVIPYTSTSKALVASFAANGKTVKVAGVAQVSGESVNNFEQPVKYVVEAEDGTTKEYTVEIRSFTGLPIVYIETENRAEITSKEHYMAGRMKLEGGKTVYHGDIEIRGRGNTSWFHMPKKPYKIKLKEKASLLGMPADRDWVLLANHADKSLMRNAIAFELSRRFDLAYTPRSQFVEVFLNGAYIGNYLLAEQVEVEKNRLDIEELEAGDVSEEVISGGYLLEVDYRLDEDFWFRTPRGIPVTIKSPATIVPEQLAYIKQYVSETEKVIYSESFADPETGYAKYIDTESFINWYLVNELLKNNDAIMWTSVYMYKDRNKKLSMGPVWDFDIGIGNASFNGNENPEGWWVYKAEWISRLFVDPAFRKMVKNRWRVLKPEINTIFTYINDTSGKLKYSQKENFEKWNMLDTYTWPNHVVLGTHENEVQHLKDWLSHRIAWLDAELNKME